MAIATQLGYDDLPALLTLQTGDEKHDWSSLSTLDVLWVLYDRVLSDDDRFLLSKGHGPTAYYAVLAAKGFIPVEDLAGFGTFDSRLGYHPDRVLVPAIVTDRKGRPVLGLKKDDFQLSEDSIPQKIEYFDVGRDDERTITVSATHPSQGRYVRVASAWSGR